MKQTCYLFFVWLCIADTMAYVPNVNPNGPDPIPNRPAEPLFKSDAVEATIKKVSDAIKLDSVRITFANCLPSTLDTTVLWTDLTTKLPKSFIITGDIPALWLRDSTYQINPYLPLMKSDPALQKLVLGLINMQSDLLVQYPYANAYFAPAYTGLVNKPNEWSADDNVSPKYDKAVVFEAKYELDSLASFLYLTKRYFEETDDKTFLSNPTWLEALKKVVQTMKDQQLGSIETQNVPKFSFTRETRSHSETQNLYGIGNPVAHCGLIRSFFRPSDDSTILQFLIPSNAMAVVGLEGVAAILDKAKTQEELSTVMKDLAKEVRVAIQKWGVIKHPGTGKSVYAFEVDCFGSQVLMDDANFPSLLSLPFFGFVKKEDPTYLATREYILSSQWNPYYFDGKYPGIGSPHTGLGKPWHMALSMQALTSTDENEMLRLLNQLVATTAGSGLMHEAYNANYPSDFSRPWFAWSNTVFGDLVMHLYNDYPHLLRNETTETPTESSASLTYSLSGFAATIGGLLFMAFA